MNHESATLRVDGVGPVLMERSRKAKRLSISIKPQKGIRVAVPWGISFSKAEQFVRSHVGWIQKHLTKIKDDEENHRKRFGGLHVVDRKSAREKLLKRIETLSNEYGFVYNKISIRNQRTRWGSCSGKDTISLNVKLVLLPDHLIDYVIMHELLHTRIKNHSRDFWRELDRLLGDAKTLRSELDSYRLDLL